MNKILKYFFVPTRNYYSLLFRKGLHFLKIFYALLIVAQRIWESNGFLCPDGIEFAYYKYYLMF